MFDPDSFDLGPVITDAKDLTAPGYYLEEGDRPRPNLFRVFFVAKLEELPNGLHARVLNMGTQPVASMLGTVRRLTPNANWNKLAFAQLETTSLPDLPLPGDLYRHYKGKMYTVCGVCLAEEDLQPIVAYKPAPGHPNYGLAFPFTRTLKEFTDRVEIGEFAQARREPRFLKICGVESRTSPSTFAVHTDPNIPEGEQQYSLEVHAVQADLQNAGWCPNACAKVEKQGNDILCPACGYECHHYTFNAGKD